MDHGFNAIGASAATSYPAAIQASSPPVKGRTFFKP